MQRMEQEAMKTVDFLDLGSSANMVAIGLVKFVENLSDTKSRVSVVLKVLQLKTMMQCLMSTSLDLIHNIFISFINISYFLHVTSRLVHYKFT